MTNVLALDQSSRTTGYSIFNPRGEIIICGSESFGSLQEQYHFFSSLLETNNISILILEDTFLGGNTKTYKTLCEVLGMFKTLAFLNNLELFVFPAAVWRSKVGLKGRNRGDLKRNAVAMVQELYNIKVNQDTSEAILIGLAYLEGNESAF